MSNCFDPFNEYEQQSSNNHKKKDMIVSVCIMLQVDTNSPEDFISASEHGEHQVHGRKDYESVEAGDPPDPCFEEVHDEEEASIDCPVSQPISVVIDFFRCCRSYTAHKRIDRSNKDRHGIDGVGSANGLGSAVHRVDGSHQGHGEAREDVGGDGGGEQHDDENRNDPINHMMFPIVWIRLQVFVGDGNCSEDADRASQCDPRVDAHCVCWCY